ncbi:MAG: coproporphyrinogen dehydrogenase HemZ [Peptococcaceae bacterium]|nr:coproporphyrinogen dehydrogenase HemZ [Peptococcaceae bacterium]
MTDLINVRSTTIEKKVLMSCSSIIAAFFPGKTVRIDLPEQNQDGDITIIIENESAEIPAIRSTFIKDYQEVTEKIDYSERPDLFSLSLPGKEPFGQILIKRILFIFLQKITQERIPWGILTGIRPGKLISIMNQLGLKKQEQSLILTELYLVEKEKADLLSEIGDVQKPSIQRMKERPDLISVYLTIPFCPSRCFYCSFPSTTLTARNKHLLPSYLLALYQEIKLTGELMKEMNLKADCIYIGGGTPTTLGAEDLEILLQNIRDHIPAENGLEYTVEGGRPDSIDRIKLSLMKESGVNRISINPQSMQEQTLIRIGRNHSVSDVVDCYRLARDIGDWTINMDLILGLPDEGPEEMMDSLKKVLALKPDNITLHALALKRGSQAWESQYAHFRHDYWSMIQKVTGHLLKEEGYKPYYLYRQKNIAGNLENTGFCLPDKACRYNIGIIEEKQHILGLGAGASSKILKRDSGHQNLYNPLDLNHYILRFAEIHKKRQKTLRESC